MSPETPTGPLGQKRPRPLLIGILVAVVIVVIVIVAVVASRAADTSAGGGPDSNSQGTDAGGSPLPVDGAGAPSVAGPTSDPADPAQPVELPPVPLESPAAITPALTVGISALAAVDGVANGVGEVSGPSLRFVVTVTNSGSDPVSLQTAVVGLTYGANQTPSNELASASTPLATEVGSGQSVTGTYVFVVPTEERDSVRITLDYQVGTPIAVFEGPAPK